jgi:prephenate dehydrogenase
MQALPERFAPIGGHPMCGKEHNSMRFAEAGLFIDAPFALTPLERTPPEARTWAQALVEAVGARPLWLDPHTHDAWAAAVSHAPYCLAACLAAVTPPEALPLAGPGLRSTTRLAGSSLTMMEHILHTNRLNLLDALERVRLQMDRLEGALRDEDWASLHECLLAGQESYAKIRL